MKLISFKAALAMTKQAIDDALIPIRVSQAKKQGEMEQLKIDEKLLSLQIELQQITVSSPINYDRLLDKIDEIDLLERRRKQFDDVISQLFSDVPADK